MINQYTYDVSREDEKYSVVEDAAPQSTNQLEKGFYVLYKCGSSLSSSSGGAAGGLSLSHSSTPTPTTPTSPDHSSNMSSHSANYSNPAGGGGGGGAGASTAASGGGGGNGAPVRYRLGKIVEYKEKTKSFLVQPVCLKSLTNNSNSSNGSVNNSGGGGSGGGVGGEITSSDLISAEWVKRPNLRVIAAPWFTEFKNELGLKSSREIEISMLVSVATSTAAVPPAPSGSLALSATAPMSTQQLAHVIANPTPLPIHFPLNPIGQHQNKFHSLIQADGANRLAACNNTFQNQN